MSRSEGAKLRDLAWTMLRLGATSFGGPAAHIALMERELVERRGWMSREEYLDLVGATNLVPGPNSTEVAIHLGLKRGGWPGFWIAGAGFILPAFCAVLFLSWLYQRGQEFPALKHALHGAMPIIVAIIAQAVYALGKTALKNALTWAVALCALLACALRINEVAIVFAGAALGLVLAARMPKAGELGDGEKGMGKQAAIFFVMPVGAGALMPLFWTFLKIGSVIYGSGYVLVAFLRADFVERLGWITEAQLLDAVAVGQMTPGPLFTSATFIGYQVAGLGGAVAATLGIFAPSFAFVALLHGIMERVKGSPRARRFLDCVNAASWSLIAFVALSMARDVLLSPALGGRFLPLVMGVLAFGLLLRRAPSLLLIAAGAVLGVATQM